MPTVAEEFEKYADELPKLAKFYFERVKGNKQQKAAAQIVLLEDLKKMHKALRVIGTNLKRGVPVSERRKPLRYSGGRCIPPEHECSDGTCVPDESMCGLLG